MRAAIAVLFVVCFSIATVQGFDAAQFRQLGHRLDEAMATMKSQVNNVNEAVAADMAKAREGLPSLPTTQAVSVTCSAAITNFNTAWTNSTCSALRNAILSYGSATQATVAAWCTSGCIELYLQVNADIQVGCSADRDTVWTQYSAYTLSFRQSIFFSKGICVAVDGTYCWPKLTNASALYTIAGASLSVQVTTSQMNEACSSCVSKMLVTLGQYGYPTLVAQVKAFEIFCLKIDGVFCRYSLNDWATAYAFDAATGRPIYATLCSTCFLSYIRKLVEFGDYYASQVTIYNPYSTLYNLFDNYCAKAPDGSYCLDRLLNNPIVYSQMVSNCIGLITPGPTSTCSTECRASLITAASLFGCCAVPAINIQFAGAVILSGGSVSNLIYNKCGGLNLNATGSLVGSCSKYLIAGNLAVNNLVYSYYTNHTAAVIAAIRADLALLLSITADKITINVVTDTSSSTSSNGFATQSTSSSVNVKYTVTPSSNAEASSVNSALSTSLSSDNTLSATSSLDLASKSDSTAPVSADASSSSQSTVDNPNASEEAANGVGHGAIGNGMVTMAIIIATIIATITRD